MVCPSIWVDSLDRAASAARELCEVRNSRGSAIVIDKLEVNHVDGAIFSLVVVPKTDLQYIRYLDTYQPIHPIRFTLALQALCFKAFPITNPGYRSMPNIVAPEHRML
jgi:hypothetical protein